MARTPSSGYFAGCFAPPETLVWQRPQFLAVPLQVACGEVRGNGTGRVAGTMAYG